MLFTIFLTLGAGNANWGVWQGGGGEMIKLGGAGLKMVAKRRAGPEVIL